MKSISRHDALKGAAAVASVSVLPVRMTRVRAR